VGGDRTAAARNAACGDGGRRASTAAARLRRGPAPLRPLHVVYTDADCASEMTRVSAGGDAAPRRAANAHSSVVTPLGVVAATTQEGDDALDELERAFAADEMGCDDHAVRSCSRGPRSRRQTTAVPEVPVVAAPVVRLSSHVDRLRACMAQCHSEAAEGGSSAPRAPWARVARRRERGSRVQRVHARGSDDTVAGDDDCACGGCGGAASLSRLEWCGDDGIVAPRVPSAADDTFACIDKLDDVGPMVAAAAKLAAPTAVVQARIQQMPTRVFIAAHLDVDEAVVADRDCCICMEEYAEGSRLRRLPCMHEFHAACIDTWLTSKTAAAACPVCRRAITDDDDGGIDDDDA